VFLIVRTSGRAGGGARASAGGAVPEPLNQLDLHVRIEFV